MVTASLSGFTRQGSRVDVTVSALGDSASLLGGTLLVTPLLGADGEVYVVAQGQLAVGGFQSQGQAESVTKGVPTSAELQMVASSSGKSDSNLLPWNVSGLASETPTSQQHAAWPRL